MVSAAPAKLDRSRIRDLTARETKRLNERTPKSGEWFERAQRTMVNGVPSSYQERDPWPIYLAEGRGSRVWDVDGNEYVDMHNAFGSMVQGHSHPAIVEAVRDRVARGTHMAAPGEDVIYVSEELARLKCPDCGIQYMEFRHQGRLGCPADYEVFRAGLEPILEKIHRATRHVGKVPRYRVRDAARRRELTDLRRELRDAVKAERYEEAARLRDLIREKEATDEPR